MEFVHAEGWRVVVLPARASDQQRVRHQSPTFRLMRGFSWQGDLTERELTLRLDEAGVALGQMESGRARPCLTLDRLSLRTCPNDAIEVVGAAWSRICEECLAVEVQICPVRSRPVGGPALAEEAGRQRWSERLREALTKVVGYAEILQDDQPVTDVERRRMSLIVHRAAGELAGMMAETS